MKQSSTYTRDFFAEVEGPTAVRSAEALVPVVLSLLRPQSVVDVGCGTGEFLSVFASRGIIDILGIDGDYIDRSLLAIPDVQFLPLDITQPISLSRTFDLALCLEVAEHLEAKFADRLIASLVRLAPVILFSAAIPKQGGFHHVNEQWPDYWAAFFEKHGY